MSTTDKYVPGDITRLLNPSFKDADSATVAQTSVAAAAPAIDERVAKGKKALAAAKDNKKPDAAKKAPATLGVSAAGAQQPRSASGAEKLMSVDPEKTVIDDATRRALAIAASLMRDKRRQFELRGEAVPMDMPFMRAPEPKPSKVATKTAKPAGAAAAKLAAAAVAGKGKKAAAAAAAAAESESEAESGDNEESDGDESVVDESDDDSDADDATDDGWRKSIDLEDEDDEAAAAAGTDDQAGFIPATAENLRAMDVRFAEVDGDCDAELEADEARRREIAKVKKYKSSDDNRNSRTVFLGNVPTSATERDVRLFLAPAGGKIESVRFRSVAFSEANMPKNISFRQHKLHASRDSMNAYAVFESEEHAFKAVAALNNTVMTVKMSEAAAAKAAEEARKKYMQSLPQGARSVSIANQQAAAANAAAEAAVAPVQHTVRVDLATGSGRADPFRSVFLGALPFGANEEAVRAHFARCGEVEFVRLVRDKKLNMGKGIGFVTFKDKFSVPEALKLNGKKFDGRALRVTKVSLSGSSATTGKATASGEVAKAKRELEARNERKLGGGRKRRSPGDDDDASADDSESEDEKLSPTELRHKRQQEQAEKQRGAAGKIQGAFMKAFASGAVLTGGGKLKKPRHVPRASSGTVGGVLRPTAWMGQVAKSGDTLGRLGNVNTKSKKGGSKNKTKKSK